MAPSRARFQPPWRAPVPEPGPITLVSRRLYILPTRIGLAYGALLFGLLMVSVNYGISLGYLFTFLLGGVGVVGLLHSQRNLLGLILRPLGARPVFAGETACYRLAVANPGRRPRGGLRLSHADSHGQAIDLAPEETGELRLELAQARRGWHPLGRLTLASTWPLGLFRCWTVFALTDGVLVYPRPASAGLPMPAPAGAGRNTSWRQPGDDEFAHLRAYRPGDPPGHIAWKSVARDQAPLTKQFAGSGGGEIWLDWHDCPETDSEARLSRLTRWVLDAEQAGLTWGLVLPGSRLPPGRGPGQLGLALEALARHDG